MSTSSLSIGCRVRQGGIAAYVSIYILTSYDLWLRRAGLMASAAGTSKVLFLLLFILEEGSEDLLSCIDYAE
jgi:hypothetical protein